MLCDAMSEIIRDHTADVHMAARGLRAAARDRLVRMDRTGQDQTKYHTCVTAAAAAVAATAVVVVEAAVSWWQWVRCRCAGRAAEW